jgi:hypothetical protein
MIYLGNFSQWIDPQWKEEVLGFDGHQGLIYSDSKENKDRYEEYQKAIAAGWKTDIIYWWRYTNQITSFDITSPPWITSNNTISWWIVKQMPTQIQPMHIDVDKNNKCKRYWIPLQDYESGHILINEDSLITNYKTGDVFEFDTPLDYHGSANLGFNPRIVLLITEHL